MRANVTSLSDLAPRDLVGPWEALMEKDGVCGPDIYQMQFTSTEDAWLVEAQPSSDPDQLPFVSRLLSVHFFEGRVKLVFAVVSARSEIDYVSVEIEGRAYGAGGAWMIDGTIVKKRKDGRLVSSPVMFRNGLWTRSIADASVTAARTLKSVGDAK